MRGTEPEMMLIVEPEALREWRIRLRLKQAELAKLANMTQDRVSVIETRVAGTIRTYIAVNRALRKVEAKQQTQQPAKIAA